MRAGAGYSWSRGGDKLLSGSDDKTLIMWLPFEGYEAKYKIITGNPFIFIELVAD